MVWTDSFVWRLFARRLGLLLLLVIFRERDWNLIPFLFFLLVLAIYGVNDKLGWQGGLLNGGAISVRLWCS